jgi:hypothetical protein
MLTSALLFKFFAVCPHGLTVVEGAIFSSGVSKRSERKASQRFSNTRDRYRVSSSPDCAVKPTHQRTHRALQDTQERQSLAPRLAEDGLSAPQFARLFEEERYPAIPRGGRPAGTAPVILYCCKDAKSETRESSNLSSSKSPRQSKSLLRAERDGDTGSQTARVALQTNEGGESFTARLSRLHFFAGRMPALRSG